MYVLQLKTLQYASNAHSSEVNLIFFTNWNAEVRSVAYLEIWKGWTHAYISGVHF